MTFCLSPSGIAWIGEIIAFPGERLMRVHSTLSHGGLILFSVDTELKVRSNRLLTFTIYCINMSKIISSNQSLCCRGTIYEYRT